jgi:hypothetical protein
VGGTIPADQWQPALNQWGGSVGGSSAPPATASPDFNVNPAPRPGQGWAGLVPGPIGLPQPARDLASQLPGLSEANQAASAALLDKLGGNLSPGTLKQMQDYEAQFAARAGMPGSNAIPGTLAYNRGVRDIGTTSEAQTEKGLADYARLVAAVSGTQTVPPSLQADIASRNAAMAAAPDPFQQQSHAEMLYNEYLNRLRGPGGGTQTGTMPSPTTFAPPVGPSGTMTPTQPANTPYGTPPEFIEYNAIDGNYYDTRTGQILGNTGGQDSGFDASQVAPQEPPNWQELLGEPIDFGGG